MKRILYLSFYFRPDLCAGSFRNSPLVDELSRQSANQNVEIEVLTTSPNRYSSFRKSYQKKETFNNTTVQRIEVPSHRSGIKDQVFSFKTYFFRVLKRTRNRDYDLVFASSSRFFTAYLGYLVAKKKNLPLYLDIRDLFSETLSGISGSWFIKNLLVPMIANRERKIFEYAIHINLISEGFKVSFDDRIQANFSFFTHGVDPVFKETTFTKPKTESDQPKNIVYAGNIGDGQGLDKIIPGAAKHLQIAGGYRFTIIGDGGARTKLEDELKRLNISNVQIKDPVDRNKIAEEYKEADILFIHLNDLQIFKKVLPSKIFELAAIEKPILAGVEGYARTFLQKNVSGVYLFNPGDVENLLEQVKEIEHHLETKKPIDNRMFTEAYDRKKIDRDMATSILNYL